MRSADKADLLQHYREFSPRAASVVTTRLPCDDQGIYTMGRWRNAKDEKGKKGQFRSTPELPSPTPLA
jgi:hypothetical protein